MEASHGTGDADRPALARFLRNEKAAILAEWQRRIRTLPPAQRLTEAELLNHLPHLLDRIARMVEDLESGQPVHDTGRLADLHALERLDEGYDLEQVVREFAVLRQCVLDLWSKQPQRAIGGPLLNEAIDEAVTVAVSRYTAARERTLVSLDRIAAAALESADLDDLLHSLTRVLLETTACVDSVAIYLRQGNQLLLRAAVGLEEHLANKVRVEIGSQTCAGEIAATGKPLIIRDATTSPLLSEPLRLGGARGFYGVPMIRDGEIVGVAHISSRTAYEFSREDKLVFGSMVERATTAIAYRRLQDELESERRRLAAVLETLPVGVFVSDEKGAMLRVNPAARSVWGERPPLAQSTQEYGHYKAWWPNGRQIRAQEWALARTLESGEPVRAEEIEIETFEGERKSILNYASPIRAEDGTLIGGVAVNVDITRRRQAERERDQLLEQERQLRETAEHALAMLDALFVDAPIGLAFFDRELRYIRINEMLAKANGRSPAEHIGRYVWEVLQEEGKSLEAVLRQVLESGKPDDVKMFAIAPPSTPDKLRDFQLSVHPVRLKDGEVVGLGAAVIEVTELVQAVRARDEFLSVASHDLKSPLAAMQLQVDGILRKSRRPDFDPTSVIPTLEKVRRQMDRVTSQLGELLDVSRLQAGRLGLKTEQVDLAELVRELAARHLEVFANSRCELRLDVRDPLVGEWDALRLEQIVTNLLTNAAKYGAGHPIEIRTSGTDTHAILTIQDHGVGIAPENHRAIFERFERVGDKSAFVGTGVGLWIVRKFVEAMGGTIRVESTLGQGAIFTVELPYQGRIPGKSGEH